MKIEVQGSGKDPYIVDTQAVTCTCRDFVYRRSRHMSGTPERLCKHIEQVFSEHSELAPVWYQRLLNYETATQDPTQVDPGDGKVRFPREFFDSYVFDITSTINHFKHIIKKYEFCGSYRRRCDKVSDLDVLIILQDNQSPAEFLDYCEDLLGYDKLWRGDKKASYKIDGIVQVDFKFVPEESWAFSTLHFTGSKNHNIEMRSRAHQFGYSLSEYGFKNKDGVVSTLGCKTEEDIFNFLRMPYKAPWDR